MRPMIDLLVASTNAKKLSELEILLHDLPFRIISLNSFQKIEVVKETGATFEENALLKATGYAEQTGKLTLAEDSGLCCDALDGAPGVYSSRFSGEGATDAGNNEKLLRLLANIPDNCRTGHYVSAVAVSEPGKVIGVVDGAVHGYIGRELKGQNGFGYDPLFYYPPYGKTFGEVDVKLKHEVSHRAMALKKVRLILENYLNCSKER